MTNNDDKKPVDDVLAASGTDTDPSSVSDLENPVTGNGDTETQGVADKSNPNVDASLAEMHEKVARLGKELEQAKAKVDENWTHFVRTKADLDNLERRARRDVENAHKYAGEKLLEAMLPVIDSLEMGAEAAKKDAIDINKVLEGMELTVKMFENTLSKFEVKRLDPIGTPFNPDFHQAITLQPSAEVAPNTVLSVLQKGYMLNERLLRPALVVVSKSVAKPKENASGVSQAPATPTETLAETIAATEDTQSKGGKIDEKA